MARFLGVQAALYIHGEQIETHGGAHGVCDQNGFEPGFNRAELFEWTMEAAIGALKREQLAEPLRLNSRRWPKRQRKSRKWRPLQSFGAS